MDLLFVEYANPFSLLDGLIKTSRFVEFIDTFEKKHKERMRWDFYINKLPSWNEMTWEDFNQKLDDEEKPKVTNEQLEATVSNSFSVIRGFNPNKEERGNG